MPTHRSKLLGWIPLLITVLSTTGAVFLLSRQLPAEGSKDPESVESATVSAFPIQITPGFDGIVLIDPQSRNLCIYQYQVRNPAHERLTLLAARNIRYDLQLDDYNNADPRPATVKEWLQRAEIPGGPIKKTGYEGKSTPPPKTTSPASDKPAWRYPTPEQSKDMASAVEKTGDSPVKSALKPPKVPSKVTLKCGNSACDFSGALTGDDFINAASLQINQIRFQNPQQYAKLQSWARLRLPELDSTSEKKVSSVVEREMIEIKLIEVWGDINQRLAFTCPKCRQNEVYRAIECKQCQEIYLPRTVRTGQSAYKCPQCGTINAPGNEEKTGSVSPATKSDK
jgi:predicted RNA-binding Zn-ribbon protein involved in translation (DUF1610 family)